MTAADAWRSVQLGQVCQFAYGKGLRSEQRRPGSVPVLGSNGIVGHHDEALTNGPTIVVGRKGSYGEVTYSPVACWPIDTAYYIDSSKADVDLRWLFRRLSGLGLSRLNRAAVLPGLNRDDAYRQRLLLPPLAEQQSIADILDRADAMRTKRREAVELLESLSGAAYVELFGEPRGNAQGWPVAQLGELLKSGPQNGLYKPSTDYGSGTLILRIDGFYDGKVNDLDELKRVRVTDGERGLYALSEGELVINRVNSREYLGKSALVPALSEPVLFESNMMRLGVDRSRVHPGYVVAFLQTAYAKSQILGAAKDAINQSSINQQDVKGLKLPVPSLDRQHEFVRRIAAIDKLKAAHRASLAEMDALFASLQHRAFRGEL